MIADPINQELAGRIREMAGMDTVDSCRLRLVSLRTRIETNWPAGGGMLGRRKGLTKASEAIIADLLVALPSPLPVATGYIPSALIADSDTDLREVAGRAVDAAMVLLSAGSLDALYPGEVQMLESYRPDALEPIMVSQPTVGLLVATIIGTLEAISERLMPVDRPLAPRDGSTTAERKDAGSAKASKTPKSSEKGRPIVRRP